MSFRETPRLDTGDHFPEMSLNSITGFPFELPSEFAGSWGIVLLYRGEWWPFCRQQLADFQKFADDFTKLDVRILAASVDSIEDASKIVKEEQLTFPVAHGLNAEKVASATGAFYEEDKKFIHATGYLFNREGTIIVASYSTGAIGRLTPQDCITLVTYLQAKQVKD